ncbi:GntR family transcriptional regulator [Acrocarpospora catenulata]|uniref:GntR family transcriptional regulator n=1 Tax=Acrocarpospora catenulata TaxID=2836182 RepID=UPI001BD961BF|nr:GntR family transcriptional regulator [Acrocarpospora catenulata]
MTMLDIIVPDNSARRDSARSSMQGTGSVLADVSCGVAGTSGDFRDIAKLLIERIDHGDLPEGARIPTVRELMRDHSVRKGTAVRAQRELRSLGLIRAVIGLGYVVGAPSDEVQSLPSVANQKKNAVDSIIGRIQRGEIAPHTRVATLKSLRTEFGASYETARSILMRLHFSGWAYMLINWGTFAVPPHFWPTKSITGVRRELPYFINSDSIPDLEMQLAVHLGFPGWEPPEGCANPHQ